MGGAVSSGRDNDELIDNLMGSNYIRSSAVEYVFRAVDRSDYMMPDGKPQAYKDLAWRSGVIHLSAPCIYSEVMEGLELAPGQSFLNIGSGTGYLSTMVGLILGSGGINHGIEIELVLIDYSNTRLKQFLLESPAIDEHDFCEPIFFEGNALCLAPLQALYDRVYCGAGCPEEYGNYMKQLIKVGGILVMPLNDQLVQIRRVSEKKWVTRNMLNVSFATLKGPVKKDKPDLLKLDDHRPPSLQCLARAAVRCHVRRALLSRRPKLKAPPSSRHPPSARPRHICIPLDEDSDVENLNTLHNLDIESGAQEMNALLNLVLSMGQNRVAGALRFDTVDSSMTSSDSDHENEENQEPDDSDEDNGDQNNIDEDNEDSINQNEPNPERANESDMVEIIINEGYHENEPKQESNDVGPAISDIKENDNQKSVSSQPLQEVELDFGDLNKANESSEKHDKAKDESSSKRNKTIENHNKAKDGSSGDRNKTIKSSENHNQNEPNPERANESDMVEIIINEGYHENEPKQENNDVGPTISDIKKNDIQKSVSSQPLQEVELDSGDLNKVNESSEKHNKAKEQSSTKRNKTIENHNKAKDGSSGERNRSKDGSCCSKEIITLLDENTSPSSSVSVRIEKFKRQKFDSGLGEENTPSGSSPEKTESKTDTENESDAMSHDEDEAETAVLRRRRLPKRSRSFVTTSSSSSSSSSSCEMNLGVAERTRTRPKRRRTPPVDKREERRKQLSMAMKAAILELPLPHPLKSYVNFYRSFY